MATRAAAFSSFFLVRKILKIQKIFFFENYNNKNHSRREYCHPATPPETNFFLKGGLTMSQVPLSIL